MDPRRPSGSLIILQRSLHAALAGAVALALLDVVFALRHAHDRLRELPWILAVMVPCGLVAGAVVGGLGAAASAGNAVAERNRRAVLALSVLLLELPILRLLPAVELRAGLPLAAVPVAAIAIAAVVARLGRRAPLPLSWAFGCLVAAGFVTSVLGFFRLGADVQPIVPALLVWLTLGGTAASVLVALLVDRLLRACAGEPVPRWMTLAAPLAGAALAVSAVVSYPSLYTRPKQCVFALSLLLFMVTAVRLPGRRAQGLWAAVAAASLAGYAYLVLALPAVSSIGWTLSHRAPITAHVLQDLPAFGAGLRRFSAEVSARPETAAARQLDARAAAWNRGEPRLPLPARPLSVLLITIDTLRYDHTGYSGRAARGLTPSLDALATRSQRFHRVYAQGAWTSLSVPSLLWSRYPQDLRFDRLYEDTGFLLHFREELTPRTAVFRVFQSPRAEPSLDVAELLSGAGLHTTAVLNDGYTNYFNPRLGFYRGIEEAIYPRVARADHATGIPNDGETATLAVEALRRQGDRRFFTWVHFFGPHQGQSPREGLPFRGYDGNIHFTDRQVGRLLATLEELGRTEDTLVVVASDHGEAFGEHANRFHGNDLFEETVRVPLLFAVPGLPARDIRAEVALVDVTPTILALTGVRVPEAMQGFGLTSLMAGSAELSRGPIFLETWRLQHSRGEPELHLVGVVADGYKVMLDEKTAAFAFYDTNSDPGETMNLLARPGAEERERFEGLAATLLGWRHAH